MADDEVSQRALEITRLRQKAAAEQQRLREARQLEIDWQVERARERLEEAQKHFLAFWSQSTRTEVVWGPQATRVDEPHSSTGDDTEIPPVSISTAIQFWRRNYGQPELVEIGVLSVSNSSLANWLDEKVPNPDDDIDLDASDTEDYPSDVDDEEDDFVFDEGIGPIFYERVPPRGFVYEFDTASVWRNSLYELRTHKAFDATSVAQFAEAVGRIAIDVVALSVSSGNSPVTQSAATAEIQQAKQNAAVQDWGMRALGFVLKWGAIGAALLFFRFVIFPPLREWLRSLGIGG